MLGIHRDHVSIHAPRKGERRSESQPWRDHTHFNPRSPQGGATGMITVLGSPSIFQSTLPARGSDWHDHCHREPVYISIHAPRKGERLCPRNGKYFNLLISIHAPHKGERRHSTIGTIQTAQFQSTLPARGSDRTAHLPTTGNPHFNPRSPQGGATAGSLPRRQHSRISIHAPRKGERPQYFVVDDTARTIFSMEKTN